jgi:formiminotetrahydrofolate cyclodeaminase
VVAAAAALLEKSARLSSKQWDGAAAALERAHAIRVESFELIEDDAQAFLAFVEAVRSEKDVETAHATLAAAAAESGFTLISVNLGDAKSDPRLALAKQLARKATGLAASLRPQDS